MDHKQSIEIIFNVNIELVIVDTLSPLTQVKNEKRKIKHVKNIVNPFLKSFIRLYGLL